MGVCSSYKRHETSVPVIKAVASNVKFVVNQKTDRSTPPLAGTLKQTPCGGENVVNVQVLSPTLIADDALKNFRAVEGQNNIYNILLAEDCSIQSMIYTCLIERNGKSLKVRRVENGLEAIQWLFGESMITKTSGIVLDFEMPLMDGLQTLVEIRRRSNNVPVVVHSSTLTDSLRTSLSDAGATAVFSKPMNPEKAMCMIRYMGLQNS
jgi:CheY-like chemotaxis protein